MIGGSQDILKLFPTQNAFQPRANIPLINLQLWIFLNYDLFWQIYTYIRKSISSHLYPVVTNDHLVRIDCISILKEFLLVGIDNQLGKKATQNRIIRIFLDTLN